MSAPEHVTPSDTENLTDAGLALCLSGGGFRAALFHLGALRRLNELGILSKVTHVASVSGGSILAAHLAMQIRDWPSPGAVIGGWQERIEAPFRTFVKQNIRTWPVLQRFLLPWNWFRTSTQVLALETRYQKDLTPLLLTDLPVHPKFTFCATDMVNGVSWIFERDRVEATWPSTSGQPGGRWPRRWRHHLASHPCSARCPSPFLQKPR